MNCKKRREKEAHGIAKLLMIMIMMIAIASVAKIEEWELEIAKNGERVSVAVAVGSRYNGMDGDPDGFLWPCFI